VYKREGLSASDKGMLLSSSRTTAASNEAALIPARILTRSHGRRRNACGGPEKNNGRDPVLREPSLVTTSQSFKGGNQESRRVASKPPCCRRGGETPLLENRIVARLSIPCDAARGRTFTSFEAAACCGTLSIPPEKTGWETETTQQAFRQPASGVSRRCGFASCESLIISFGHFRIGGRSLRRFGRGWFRERALTVLQLR